MGKICYVGDQKYEYAAGNVLVMFYPVSVEYEIVAASPKVPYIVAGVAIDMEKMADVLLRIDQIDSAVAKPISVDPFSIFSLHLNDNLLGPFIRLFNLLDDPRDAAMFGDSIVDEIY